MAENTIAAGAPNAGTTELNSWSNVGSDLGNVSGPGINLRINASTEKLNNDTVKQLIDAQASGAFWNGIEKTGIAVGNVIGSILTNRWNSEVVAEKFKSEVKIASFNKDVLLEKEATTVKAIEAQKEVQLAQIKGAITAGETAQAHQLRLAQVVEGAKTERLELMQAYGSGRENYGYGNPFAANV
ncbi:MAG: hypothetical protein COX62_06725 [Deltaproteobacteria bacterium CG_4_10_14_0_2_um_filter_43_8]|nr:MAG: hypothetical protein COV43_03145 [Deltaproteobacteria bacterium CG11_big_fil_rev_8_21_14_0_20_42_23]PJA19457.1 MAG: hypothetical protein COX62_06725 [Deltaproteobacteria bacterium CG_4_10_14_0_2_um_filter_43_8]PJC63773.1 MAG: hypothetical protein CO021_07760 [Deltaproteobacteria bacterium CG_4_9_14_0_2_um_filter_42_21]